MNCKKCGNTTEFIPNYVHEDIETNIDVTHDVHLCSCGVMYYKEGIYNITEIPVRETKFTYIPQTTDYQLAISKMKEKEYAEEVQVN